MYFLKSELIKCYSYIFVLLHLEEGSKYFMQER